MTDSKTGAELRLERLGRVLAGRRARLASTLARQQRQAARSGPVGNLQRYGYPVALLLAMTAVLPTVIGFGFRRRRLLFGAATSAMGIRKLQKRLEAARASESRW